jgi:exodeoxyribonuclease-1
VVIRLAPLPNRQGALVYDLRYDPMPLLKLSAQQLAERMVWQPRSAERIPFPVKALRFNRCPAVAPISVLDAASQERLRINVSAIDKHRRTLEQNPEFVQRVSKIYGTQALKPEQSSLMGDEHRVDGQLYDGFLDDSDKQQLAHVRTTSPGILSDIIGAFHDDRLNVLLPLYKARNYPESLTNEERRAWEAFCTVRLLDGGSKSRLAKYFSHLEALANIVQIPEQQYVLEELKLYGESIMPAEQ